MRGMRKRRILAMLLAACMIVESAAVVSAAEPERTAAKTMETETTALEAPAESAEEETTAGNEEQVPSAEENGADKETETPEKNPADSETERPGEGVTEEQEPEDMPGTPEQGAGEESGEGTEDNPAEDTEQPPAEDGADEPEQDPGAEEDPADAPEAEEPVGLPDENMPVEEEPVDEAQIMSQAEPLSDEEITPGGTDMKITSLKLRQEYGGIVLVWKYDWNDIDVNQVSAVFDRCRVYRSETENGSYELIWETTDEDGHYSYRDDDVERVAGGAANKTYYYKVSVVYSRSEKDETGVFGDNKPYESELSAPVNNADDYYYRNADFFLNDEPEYIGVYVTDDDGNRLDSITLKEGKATSLRVTAVKADGTKEQVTGRSNSTWILCRQYYTGKEIAEKYYDEFDHLGEDKATLLPELGEDTHVYVKALSGSAGSDTCYLIYKMEDYSRAGAFIWQIPVSIEEGDGSDEQIDTGVYNTKESLCQGIRDTMVAREDTTLYATGGYEWWAVSDNPAGSDLDFEDVFDFHRERAGMKPCEGDYLLLAMGDASSEVWFGSWLEMKDSDYIFGGQYLTQYTVTPHFITTRGQEDQVDRKINELIHTEGGALHSYKNAGDYAKIKAAYNYVRDHVSYIGTTTPIYHTCYSALINRKATCQGYALLFYRLVRELGIPCRVLMGVDANAHTYNIVQLDGAWYYVDTNAGVLLKGTDDFQPATLQSQYRTPAFTSEYLSKISKKSYAGSGADTSGLKAVESLTSEEIRAIDGNLTAAADRMKATYTIGGAAVKASGTVKYLEGCSRYLGYEENKNMPASGYFLGLKLSVDTAGFTKDGTVTVSYFDQAGVQKSVSYGMDDLKDGAVALLVNVTENPGMKISVDYDGEGETSRYEAMVYDLDLSGLKRESRSQSSGTTKEVNKYGIGLSAPIVKKSADGKTMEAVYEAVAYSDHVKWTAEAEEQKGNYIALRIDMPESVKATELAKSLEVTTDDGAARAAQTLKQGWNETADCYMDVAEDRTEIYLAMQVEKNFTRRFMISWGGTNPLAFVQSLTISVPADSALESRSENALLPGSIAFNGLVPTMYVGQNQNVNITFQKKYEKDEIQVFYVSDAADVVAVNRITGVLRALKPGTAQITVSAVDKSGNVITKTARITVKELPAPTGLKTSLVRDHNVSVSWKANTTGQYTEIYAIPYRLTTFGTNKKGWIDVVENALKEADMDEVNLASLDDDEKAEKLNALKETLGTGAWAAVSVPAKDSSVTLEGLQAETAYILYARNVSVTAASTLVSAGAAFGKVETSGPVFHTIRLQLKKGDGTVLAESTGEVDKTVIYEVTDTNIPVEFSWRLLDESGAEMNPAPVFTNIRYTTGNGGIVSVSAPKNGPVGLKYGSQVGETVLMVTGKDASGMLRSSEQIRVRVVKAPGKLKDKSTTLTIGQSVSLRELIGTDLKGTTAGMNLGGIDFASALKVITDSKCFAVSWPDSSETQKPEDAVITAMALIEGKSGNKLEVPFQMGSSAAKAKIQIKDMTAASISRITVRDTSALIEFKPAPAVMKVSAGSRYYTMHITDKVTGESVEAAETETAGIPYTCTFTEGGEGKNWTCEVKGLSSNKAYEAVLTAHYDADDSHKNAKPAKARKFTTKKPLLNAEGSIGINYVSLDKLHANPDDAGTGIDYDAEGGVMLENNGTYVFMAQVSNLARTLETDKLKWTISSGDKRAASTKASSSSFEMQLTTKRTGTFTVTAASTATKMPVATFVVTVVPYQSGGAGAPEQPPVPDQTALLPEAYTGDMLKSKQEDAA